MQNYQIFVSYRRDTGEHLAMLVRDRLEKRRYRVLQAREYTTFYAASPDQTRCKQLQNRRVREHDRSNTCHDLRLSA